MGVAGPKQFWNPSGKMWDVPSLGFSPTLARDDFSRALGSALWPLSSAPRVILPLAWKVSQLGFIVCFLPVEAWGSKGCFYFSGPLSLSVQVGSISHWVHPVRPKLCPQVSLTPACLCLGLLPRPLRDSAHKFLRSLSFDPMVLWDTVLDRSISGFPFSYSHLCVYTCCNITLPNHYVFVSPHRN